MSIDVSPADADTGAECLLPRLLARMLFRPATVQHNRPLPAGLHLITLQGPSLQGLRWMPGDKLQLKLGPCLSTRTYTPIEWDARTGTTRLLAHALGLAAAWRPRQAMLACGQRSALMDAAGALDLRVTAVERSPGDAHVDSLVGATA